VTERRRDPLTGEWRTFATHRQDRTFLPAADECPLCPGPGREVPAGVGDAIVVFDNRFPSFLRTPPATSVAATDLYAVEPAAGAAEVVVYSGRHDATLADLGPDCIERLVHVWADRYRVLGARDEVRYVFVFENRGEAVGVTLHHPHGQIYGYPEIPPMARRALDAARRHHDQHGTCVVCDVVRAEQLDDARAVARNASFLAFVPFAARFPYEIHVTARRHAGSLLDLSDRERRDLAELLDAVVRRYDALFGFTLPYVMSIHQRPTDGGDWDEVAHLRIELTPLHRTASKLKYLAGSELHAGAFVNDAAPEATAAELRGAVAAST
jgi:UDPglucose--hexose-1-phosphate uridylyltransferase